MLTRWMGSGLVLAALAGSASAQDLYDPATLRTFNITFHDTNWEQLLRANYSSETPILADLEVDGETYPDVGVRIRGNTSYTALPSGSQKFSLKVKMDYVHEDQDLMGYDTLNLNNAFHDPTFCREVVYNNFVAQYIPHPRANHALVTLNGDSWGVYVNTQQPDKTMLGAYFADNDGVRIKCANNPNGPGLQYAGTSPSSYSGYEIQNDGGLADPLAELIETCNAVTNGSVANWETDIDTVFAVDPSIWSIVLENMLADDDSYVNKGADFMAYQNPLDGRMHLLQRDGNETFTNTSWSVTMNFSSSNKPVLSHVLDAPELRQRYMAHYRAALEALNWSTFEPLFTAQRDLIDAAVQADPKKLYTYAAFTTNFTSSVSLGGGGPSGGTVVGLQQFFDTRSSSLASNAELNAAGPTIVGVGASDESPDPSETVWITADVAPNGNAVDKVELFYRPAVTSRYLRAEMLDDGNSGDGAAGDGVYGVELPVAATSGLRVAYYVMATADNSYGSLTFLPVRSEYDPMFVDYTFGASGGMRISEWAYSADSGEFIEFTNMSESAIDMTGWSFDDSHAVAGAFDLSAFGSVAPGESVVITEAVAEDFRTAWGLGAGVKIIGELGVTTGNNLGRNDQINLFNDAGTLVDRLDFGDEDYAGSIRTKDASGQGCAQALGQNDALLWSLSEAGDAFGSFAASTGEFGTPGSYNAPSCNACPADLDGNGVLNLDDVNLFAVAFTGGDLVADLDGNGTLNLDDVNVFAQTFVAGCP
ncbi:MAG: CotH kinase family protein [Phycisphaerales bacterium]